MFWRPGSTVHTETHKDENLGMEFSKGITAGFNSTPSKLSTEYSGSSIRLVPRTFNNDTKRVLVFYKKRYRTKYSLPATGYIYTKQVLESITTYERALLLYQSATPPSLFLLNLSFKSAKQFSLLSPVTTKLRSPVLCLWQ